MGLRGGALVFTSKGRERGWLEWVQYLVLYPNFFSTSLRRFGMEWTSLRQYSLEILFHSSWQYSQPTSAFGGFLAWTLTFRRCQQFSIGLRSGFMDGHTTTLIFLRLKYSVATREVCFGSLSAKEVIHSEFQKETKPKWKISKNSIKYDNVSMYNF